MILIWGHQCTISPQGWTESPVDPGTGNAQLRVRLLSTIVTRFNLVDFFRSAAMRLYCLMTENSLAPAWTFLAFIGNDNDSCSPWCIIPMIILGHEWLKVSSKLSTFPVPYLPKLLNKTSLTLFLKRLLIDTKLVTRALSSVLSPILRSLYDGNNFFSKN